MELFKLVTAFGFGAIFVKVIDAAWIQPFLAKKELQSWLREKRMDAFSELSRNLLAFSLEDKDNKGPFENFAIAARAIILVDDECLVKRIDQYIAKRDRLFRISDNKEKLEEGESGKKIYDELYKEARKIVMELKLELRGTRI